MQKYKNQLQENWLLLFFTVIFYFMATIHITRSHQLDQETVRSKVQELANILAEKLSAEYQWEQDRLVFRRSGANGFIRIGDQELEVEIKLAMMLSPLKGMIEKTISEHLDQQLT